MRIVAMRTFVPLALIVLPALCSCNKGNNDASQVAAGTNPQFAEPMETSSPMPIAFRLTDVTKEARIKFTHNNGAFGAMFLPETMGSGAAFIDYDGDGWQDIYFVNGRNWTKSEINAYKRSPVSSDEARFLKEARKAGRSHKREVPPNKVYRRTLGALYRNNRDGTFTDVTRGSGLEIEMLGMGAAVGDYDNDGRSDLCLTSYGRSYLFRNLTKNGSSPQFREEAVTAGVNVSDWSTCVAFLDYDKDGRLDLFIGRYLKWSPTTDIFRTLNYRRKSYGWPVSYKGQTSRLYRNIGNGRFEDVSIKAGISRQPSNAGKPPRAVLGKALGVVVSDPNKDNWPDLVVANDMLPNFYFRNQGNGRFTEVAAQSGIALSEQGKARGGMGIDAADILHEGRETIAIGHFNSEMLGLFYDRGGGAFDDIAPDSNVGRITNWFLTFGVLFVDVNNDGWDDLLVANGHIDPDVEEIGPAVGYAQRALLFMNESQGQIQPRFSEIGDRSGTTVEEEIVARGAAAADYDLDGDLDLLLTTNGGTPRLWRNDGGNAANSVRLVLRGDSSNKSAIGVKVEAHVGTDKVYRWVRSGSSYLSQSELPLTVGLGEATKIDTLIVRWPGGAVTKLQDVAANQILTISEKGTPVMTPFPKQK